MCIIQNLNNRPSFGHTTLYVKLDVKIALVKNTLLAERMSKA